MTKLHSLGIIIKRKTIIGISHGPRRLAFLIFCMGALSIFAGGCTLLQVATAKWNVDPKLAKTTDLNFKQPAIKTKGVLLFSTKGADGVPKGPYRQAFLDALKNSGAFSQIAEAKSEHDLKKYSGWDVIRVQMTCLGSGEHGSFNALTVTYNYIQYKYEGKIRFEPQSPGVPLEYVYPASIWHSFTGGKPPTDESHPLTGKQDEATRLFAKEIIMAACSEAQRSGHYFQ